MDFEERSEAEANARTQALEALDKLYPGVFGNPYIPSRLHPPQVAFLGAHLHADPDDVFEMLYGGAAGGGKSEAILAGAAQYVDRPDYAGICVRRTYAELAQPDALMDRAHKWWGYKSGLPESLRPHWNGTVKLFTFPSGARVKFAYHASPKDDLQFQGAQYQYAGWDELTHWPDDTAYEWVALSRLRRTSDATVPLRSLSGSNPGGPGHTWVRDRFPGTIGKPGGHPYMPARIKDNPSLAGDLYARSLARMHPTRRAQLLNGDWRAREPGDYFRVEWFGPFIKAEQLEGHQRISIRWWDLAASEAKTAARTAGVLMSRLRSGVRVIEHAVAFRKTPGSRDAAIVRQAKLDGRETIVGLELEPGSGGMAQVENLAKTLREQGFRVVWARPRVQLTDAESKQLFKQPTAEKGKVGRADPVSSCLERGYSMRAECPDTGEPWWGEDAHVLWFACRDGIRLVVGEWTQAYLDEVESFPGATLMDYVDATSGAWAWLEAHPYGLRGAPDAPANGRTPAQVQDVHPEERDRLGVGAALGYGAGHDALSQLVERRRSRHAPQNKVEYGG